MEFEYEERLSFEEEDEDIILEGSSLGKYSKLNGLLLTNESHIKSNDGKLSILDDPDPFFNLQRLSSEHNSLLRFICGQYLIIRFPLISLISTILKRLVINSSKFTNLKVVKLRLLVISNFKTCLINSYLDLKRMLFKFIFKLNSDNSDIERLYRFKSCSNEFFSNSLLFHKSLKNFNTHLATASFSSLSQQKALLLQTSSLRSKVISLIEELEIALLIEKKLLTQNFNSVNQLNFCSHMSPNSQSSSKVNSSEHQEFLEIPQEKEVSENGNAVEYKFEPVEANEDNFNFKAKDEFYELLPRNSQITYENNAAKEQDDNYMKEVRDIHNTVLEQLSYKLNEKRAEVEKREKAAYFNTYGVMPESDDEDEILTFEKGQPLENEKIYPPSEGCVAMGCLLKLEVSHFVNSALRNGETFGDDSSSEDETESSIVIDNTEFLAKLRENISKNNL